MTTQDVRNDIARLEAVRRQTQFWRIGFSVALLAITLGSLATIRNSVNGLLQPGATQDQFSAKLTSNLQHDVVPQVQQLATRTLTEMRPEVQTAFTKLNGRVPDISQAAVKEFDTLQTDVPASGQKALEKTFGDLMNRKEGEFKKQFPDASDDKIKAMTKNISDEAAEQIVHSQDKLFSKHLGTMNSIVGHLQTIQDTEKVSSGDQNADWDLVVSMLDMARNDAGLTDKASGGATGKTAPASAKTTSTTHTATQSKEKTS